MNGISFPAVHPRECICSYVPGLAPKHFLGGRYLKSLKELYTMSTLTPIANLLQINLQQFQYIVIALGIVLFIIILVYIGLSASKEETE